MQDDKSRHLQTRAIKAMAHLGLGGALGKLLSLSSTLILARLLSPQDYGVMALAMIVISFVGFFNEVGIGAAIVQKTDLTTTEVNGCFAIAVLCSLVLSGLTILGSGLAADFFHTPILRAMISILATAFILGSFNTVPMAFLRKELKFKIIAIINFLGVLVQSLTSIILAANDYGAWSLVWGFVASSAVQTLCAFWFSSWRPSGGYDLREAADLVFYGLHVTTSRIFWYLYSNADKVIISKLLGNRELGIYDMSFGLASLPSEQISTLVTNVASPLFSKLQHNLQDINHIILKFSRGIAYITYPVLIGMLACSHELIVVLLGEKWLEIQIPFGALCLRGLLKSIDPLLSQVLISTGHAKKLAAYTALCSVVMSSAVMIGALTNGLLGISIMWVIIYPLLTIKLLQDICAITGMSMWTYYKNLVPVILASIVMGLVTLLIRIVGLHFTHIPSLLLSAEIISGILSYAVWMVVANRKSLVEIQQVLTDIGVPSRYLQRWPFIRSASTP